MRTQATKPSPKKGASIKTPIKKRSRTLDNKSTSKKVQNLIRKTSVKPSKKSSVKDAALGKQDEEPESKMESLSKAGPSKSLSTISSKKNKSDTKDKKETPKVSPDTSSKKSANKIALNQSPKLKKNSKVSKKNYKEEIKYKLNSDIIKTNSKFSKAKTMIKKGPTTQKKKTDKPMKKSDDTEKKTPKSEIECLSECVNSFSLPEKSTVLVSTIGNQAKNSETKLCKVDELITKTPENKSNDHTTGVIPSNSVTSPLIETPKPETERPPKFFTSSRCPRTVDIDVKCCKTTKGNISVSERFLSMKCVDSRSQDNCKDKNSTSSLISQGPEIDVYTFTDKVDSPKSILSGFRSPINKSIGRVRPIARVKGTVVDKNKNDTEKKKYSPHRPIEEVVKQLKANKKSVEEIKSDNLLSDGTSSASTYSNFIKSDEEDTPHPIVSKSYKMVARKTSIPGKPFSPIKFLEQDQSANTKIKNNKNNQNAKKSAVKSKKKNQMSDEEIETSKFSFNTKSKGFSYSSSDESVSESNDDTKESSESEAPKTKAKNKKYKRITDSARKKPSKELQELSKDSLVDLKEESTLIGKDKPSKRRLKLISMWSGPKKHRMASLNALAKVHCLYENESRTHMELGLMKTVDRPIASGCTKTSPLTKKKESKPKDVIIRESTSESEYENKDKSMLESSEEDTPPPSTRTLRGVPGIRSAGKYWDPKSSTSSSEDSEQDSKKKIITSEKKKSPLKNTPIKPDPEKLPAKMKKTSGVPVKKKRNRNEVVMDLKDMVVQKRMASLNATAILAASYEKRSPKSSKDDTTSDSCSDDSFCHSSKNGVSSGVKSELKIEEPKQEIDDVSSGDRKQKLEVIMNQDTDVTITGVYSTHHHEGFCTVSGMQYRISSTSHTQTTATANCDKEGCAREEGTARYTPLSALSSMQPPAEHAHNHPHPVSELSGLSRRAAGCSSAFTAPPPAPHHDPGKMPSSSGLPIYENIPPISPIGYYQPAGPLIKESGADAERALARYHPPPHYHAPHPPVLQQYGPPYYPPDLCYGRYYRNPGPYHMPPPSQPDAQMVGGVGTEPYPPPQYYGAPPCYQHSPQRVPYIECRGCPCPMNAYPKNVHIGPVTGKAPTGGGPADSTSVLPPGGAFGAKVRAAEADTRGRHGSGKDPPAAADAPRPRPPPARDVVRPAEAAGPPSPARGSAGVCAPQPPPLAPRRARLGKAMARRSLTATPASADDTALLLGAPVQPPTPTPTPPAPADADDDVLAVSPPTCAPIDLSSSDETERRDTPLLDVKKENEGPTCTAPRKPDALALREHNSAAHLLEPAPADAAKTLKRRYSKPKLEIELRNVDLEDGCKTNGIGEHVKLQKRRKVAPEPNELPRVDVNCVDKNMKRKASPKTKRSPRKTVEKKCVKRKHDSILIVPQAKKNRIDSSLCEEESRVNNNVVVSSMQEKNQIIVKPKTKSALVLDNLIRKNSVDRPDAKTFVSDDDINPAELFLSPSEHSSQNGLKRTLNINNNIVDGNSAINCVRPKTISAVTQLITKKLSTPKMICKTETAITNHSEKLFLKEVKKNEELRSKEENDGCKKKLMQSINNTNGLQTSKINAITEKLMSEAISVKSLKLCNNSSVGVGKTKSSKPTLMSSIEPKSFQCATEPKQILDNPLKIDVDKDFKDLDLSGTIMQYVDDTKQEKTNKRSKLLMEKNESIDKAIIEKVSKLLSYKKPSMTADKTATVAQTVDKSGVRSRKDMEPLKQDKKSIRPKLSMDKSDTKDKSIAEKPSNMMVYRKPVIKVDEASLAVTRACAYNGTKIRARRRRSGVKRRRAPLPALAPPDTDAAREPPRWSNGWDWDGDNFIAKVYVNNDTRLDRTARCWPRMSHTSGDRVSRGDCVLLRASSARAQPFVARVAHLWENPDDGEMMVSLVWYYRPEHTERGRQPEDAPDEVFASRHRDANSVACIEDKCYVLTFNEYCRYRKRLKAAEEGVTITPSIVPPMPSAEIASAIATNDTKLPPSVSPELVLFCRKIYDFRSKKLQVPNK